MSTRKSCIFSRGIRFITNLGLVTNSVGVAFFVAVGVPSLYKNTLLYFIKEVRLLRTSEVKDIIFQPKIRDNIELNNIKSLLSDL